jgi:dolichol-phosphate mannosyltransferase
LVVIPTYNERASLPGLLERIKRAVPGASVLIVDDSSPDGTAGLVRGLSRKSPWKGRLFLLKRPGKMGLGSAYVAGFRYALAHKRKFDPIIQMDADGSHDPASLPAMIKALSSRELVIGSRYIRGLRVIDWPWTRLLLSMAANTYARIVTGIPVTDLTGGFNGIRAHTLRQIDPSSLRCNGYAFQVELKSMVCRIGGRIGEIPIIFTGRMEGKSKLSRSVIFEAVFAVWRMRLAGGGSPVPGRKAGAYPAK